MALGPTTENATIELRWNGYHIQIIEDYSEHWLIIARDIYDNEADGVETRKIALPANGLDQLIAALQKVRAMYHNL